MSEYDIKEVQFQFNISILLLISLSGNNKEYYLFTLKFYS
ncbi:MAG: hypothetical protein ACI87F_000751, partial [Candidatus Azotimanducaceae bacterium]